MGAKHILWVGIAATSLVIAIIACFLPVGIPGPSDQSRLSLGWYAGETTIGREITYCSETGLEVTVPGPVPANSRILVEATFTYNVSIPASGLLPTSSGLRFFIGDPDSSCQSNNGWFTEERWYGYSHEPTNATHTTSMRMSFDTGMAETGSITFKLWADKSDEGGDHTHHFVRGNMIAYVYEPLE